MPEIFYTPADPDPNEPANIFQINQLTRQFHEELVHREAFERYCQWYYETAEFHRREWEKMQGDINILGWLSGGSDRG
jgi:hypothetical protein